MYGLCIYPLNARAGFFFFLQKTGEWRMVTMVLTPFTRRNKKTWPFFSSCECLLSKDTGNSDSQNDIY